LVAERKIAGILAEAAETQQGLAVVLGIGVNLVPVSDASVPLESAASLTDHLPEAPDRSEVLQALIRNVVAVYETLMASGGPDTIIAMWRERSSYFSGKRVRVMVGGNELTGTTDGLESDGALRLRTGEGDIQIVRAGDVEQLRAK
jgi:BirA family biotin operon repressor/biotin-[acetyl-CoA-carboxylase] ligase